MGAKSKPQETLSLAELGATRRRGEAGSKTEVLGLGAAAARGDARKIEDDGTPRRRSSSSWSRSGSL